MCMFKLLQAQQSLWGFWKKEYFYVGLHLCLSSLQGLFSHIKQYSKKKKERKKEEGEKL